MGVGDEYRLVNVIHPPKNRMGDDLWLAASGRERDDAAASIQSAVDALSEFRGPENPIGVAELPPPSMGMAAGTPRPKKGGTVYFPPGTYLIRRDVTPPTAPPGAGVDFSKCNAVFGGSLFVPEDVTLEFAPGAVLKLEAPATPDADGARIEIRGGINAGLQKIFDVWTPMRRGRAMVAEIMGEMPTNVPLAPPARSPPSARLFTEADARALRRETPRRHPGPPLTPPGPPFGAPGPPPPASLDRPPASLDRPPASLDRPPVTLGPAPGALGPSLARPGPPLAAEALDTGGRGLLASAADGEAVAPTPCVGPRASPTTAPATIPVRGHPLHRRLRAPPARTPTPHRCVQDAPA